MPKERLHIYLADELLKRCAGSLPPNEIHSPPTHPETDTKRGRRGEGETKPPPFLKRGRGVSGVSFLFPPFSKGGQGGFPLASPRTHPLGYSRRRFYIGAISPDIFFYDLPSFSLSPLGNALHDLMDREGISIVCDWIAQTSSPLESVRAGMVPWGFGFACHFLADAAWHPVINELSGSMDYCAGKRLSEIECHRLLESELEALWLAGSPTPRRYDELLEDFKRDRGLLLEIASYYRGFLEFAGVSSRARPAPADAEVFERRIVKCFLWQNFLLRLFANRMLGRQRDRLLSFRPTRFLGALVTPVRPVLPALFSRTLPGDRNPFSDFFMEQAMTSLESRLCAFAKQLTEGTRGDAGRQN